MFGTIIIDAYKKVETEQIADAIEELCSPNDNYGWSSAGIYCFWDYYTKEILYIGLAADLCERFKQHNGIIVVDDNSCKRNQIESYFNNNEKIGYSIFVQSPMSQPITHRNQKEFMQMMGVEFSKEDYVGQEGQDHIKQAEGILIEAFKKANGVFPKWNRIGGAVYGQNASKIGNYEIVKAFNDFDPNPIVARYSLREIASNATYERYESFLHAVRMSMLMSGLEFGKAVDFYKKTDILNTYDDIVNEGYMYRKLSV